MIDKFVTVNLNARVRAKLTPFGLATLYAARATVCVPNDILERRGEWETQLWQFMAVFGPHLYNGAPEVPTVLNVIEIEPEPDPSPSKAVDVCNRCKLERCSCYEAGCEKCHHQAGPPWPLDNPATSQKGAKGD